MTRTILLDSGPLGLLVHRKGVPDADACRDWFAKQVRLGNQIVIPEIVDYELRRELLRLNKTRSLGMLDSLLAWTPKTYLKLETPALRLAAKLWADARRAGIPTAAPHELDVDVILAAQALTLGLPSSDFIVATSNPVHLTRFTPADLWQNI